MPDIGPTFTEIILLIMRQGEITGVYHQGATI